jgi:hypothetical protein
VPAVQVRGECKADNVQVFFSHWAPVTYPSS